MIVYVNEVRLEIFSGATVGDAVKKFSDELYHKLISGQIFVHDRFGNKTEADGALLPAQHLFLK